MNEQLVDDLLANYVHQKELLLEDAKCAGMLNKERLMTLMRPRIEQMAAVVHDWDIRPDMLMAAVFGWAKKNRHPDGPMPNMLLSVKYLTKALGDYLQVPYEAVVGKRSMKIFLERKDYEFRVAEAELKFVGITDLVTATSYPVEYRCLMALRKLDWDSVALMAPEVLEAASKDRRIRLWLDHRGVTYEKLAAIFNRWKKSHNV